MTVWLLAAERVTVKTAGAVPVLPSVMVTSLMESVGSVAALPTAFRIAWLIA